MAILTPIILLAQNASSAINDNLQVTEDKLQNANQELDLLKEQYNNILTQSPETTFFNFANMYFWFVLVGLLLLAFGLLFLLAELQNKDRSKKSKVESIKKGKQEELIDEKEEEDALAEEKVEEDVEDDEEDVAEEEPELTEEAEEEEIEEEEGLFDEDESEEESAQGGPASGGEEEKPVKKTDKPIKIKVEKIK